MKKLVTVLAAIVFVGTSLSACASNSSDGIETTDFAGIQEEYLETLETLAFPPDTPKPTKMEGEDETMLFQKGWGNTMASQHWECAWEKEWLDTYATDSERAEVALKELEKAPEMPYMKEPVADDSVRNTFAEIMEKARLGDPSRMQSYVYANCN